MSLIFYKKLQKGGSVAGAAANGAKVMAFKAGITNLTTTVPIVTLAAAMLQEDKTKGKQFPFQLVPSVEEFEKRIPGAVVTGLVTGAVITGLLTSFKATQRAVMQYKINNDYEQKGYAKRQRRKGWKNKRRTRR